MKKFLTTLICICMILTLTTACNKKTKPKKIKKTPKVEVKKNDTGCDILECIKKVNYKTTKEEIDKLTGKTGVEQKNESGVITYLWKINSDDSIESKVNQISNTATISIKFKDEIIQNDKVDFSKAKDLKKDLDKGEGVKYDEVKERFGKTEGTLIEVTPTYKTYRWVNKKGGYINASFADNTGNCITFNGEI